jgi:hypothetical protein
MPAMNDPIARGGGVTASTADLLLALKLGGGGPLREILARRAAAARARSEGLSADAEEVEDALEDFFSENELFEGPQREAWFRSARVTREALAARFEELVLVRKLRERLAPDAAIEKHFQANRHRYATADVERLDFDSKGAAAETALQLREGEIEWSEAVARAGGVEGLRLSLVDAPEDAAAELFSSEIGGLVGPIEGDDDYALYRVVARNEAELDDDLREEIRGRLADEDLARAFEKKPLEFLA